MNKRFAILTLCFAVASPLFAQKKEDERLANSASVVREILAEHNGLPTNVLNQAYCVLVFPSVKKVAIGVGGSYGRGALVCRKGAQMNESWGAPVMFSLDQSSLGVQLGSTATDFVLVLMNEKIADQIMNGKTDLGSSAAAAAGPMGAEASSYHGGSDVLTYSRSKGLFGGVSLTGGKLEEDKSANKSLYGKEISAKEIVSGAVPVVPAAQPLVNALDAASPSRK
jgi:lipid-binding SYLF domain-containing protein